MWVELSTGHPQIVLLARAFGFAVGHCSGCLIFRQRLSSIKGCLPPKVILPRRSFSNKDHLPPKVVFHQRSSSNEGCLPPKVVFLLKVVFKWRLYSTNGHISTKGCLPLNVVFHRRWSSTYHNTLYLWEQSTYQISYCYLQCMMHDVTT